MIVLPLSSPLLSPPVLAKLQQADLITRAECIEAIEEGKALSHVSDLVAIQRGKSPEVKAKTTEILKSCGFEKESEFLSGIKTQSPICLYVCVLCNR